jgi:Protein of unknown function (DUF3761)
MPRFGLILFASLLSTLAIGAEPHWEMVAAKPDYSMVVFLDKNSVKTRDGHLTAWLQSNFTLVQKTSDTAPKDYLSSLTLEAFDCSSDRNGTVSITLYSGAHGAGEVVESETINPRRMELGYPPPGTVAKITLDAVCQVAAQRPQFKAATKPVQSLTNLAAPSVPLPTQLTNDNHYINSDGNQVHSPAHSRTGAIPAGATAQCADGEYSFSQHHQGTCSHHGGVASWMN